MSEENKETTRDEKEEREEREAEAVREPITLFEVPTETPPKKPRKSVSLSTMIVTCIALVLAAVMVTYTLCNLVPKKVEDDRYYPFELFDEFLEKYSFEDMNEAEMMAAALKSYVYATGDLYAEYYTAEEYYSLMDTSAGNSEGIGVNIINTEVEINGVSYKVFRVINVMKDSPAEAVGLKTGDLIYAVGIGENLETLNALGYDVALKRLQGASGTVAELTALRMTEDGYEPIPFTIERAKIKTTSVYSHRSTLDENVGIVKIVQFDLTTPTQFSEAVDTLKAAGCDRFVFDVRYNPGGDLASISAVLSYFLEKDDVIIRVKDKAGNEEISVVAPVTYTGNYASCSVSEADIGKYKDLRAVVLCNGSTASAAELFTAAFRDYELAPVVGTTTFGKGSMQSIISLFQYGYSGALKLTTAMYYPPKGEGYDGVGITPDVEVALDEAAAQKNVYELTDEEDNQLKKALECFQ